MKYLLLLLVAINLAMSETNYFRELHINEYYPEISQKIINAIFNNSTEINTINNITSNNFYFLPIVSNELSEYKKGAYIVVQNDNNKKILQPLINLKIELYFNSENQISTKIIAYGNNKIDKVKYYYNQNSTLYAVKSEIYGIKYFFDSSGEVEKITRNILKIFNYVY